MTLAEAAHGLAQQRDPAVLDLTAYSLFCRLGDLLRYLIRISNFGVLPPRQRGLAGSLGRPRAAPASAPAMRLPSRPGWLLGALPDIAPDIAPTLRALLADPALVALLAADPSLPRRLRFLLRGLDLELVPPTPPAPTPPAPAPGPKPPPERPATSIPASPPTAATPTQISPAIAKSARPALGPSHA